MQKNRDFEKFAEKNKLFIYSRHLNCSKGGLGKVVNWLKVTKGTIVTCVPFHVVWEKQIGNALALNLYLLQLGTKRSVTMTNVIISSII